MRNESDETPVKLLARWRGSRPFHAQLTVVCAPLTQIGTKKKNPMKVARLAASSAACKGRAAHQRRNREHAAPMLRGGAAEGGEGDAWRGGRRKNGFVKVQGIKNPPTSQNLPRQCPSHQRPLPPSIITAIPQIPRFNVLGVAVSGMDLQIAVQAVLAAAREKRKGYICVTGVHGVSEAQRDPAFRRILNGSFLNTTDGMPLVWLGRRALDQKIERVYGPDFMLEIFAATQKLPFRHFFYGGAPGVAGELRASLENRFPGVQIVGTYTPPFRPLNAAEEAGLSPRRWPAGATRPDVGRAEHAQAGAFHGGVSAKARSHLDGRSGRGFDFHSGRVRQAPRWIQRRGSSGFTGCAASRGGSRAGIS